MEPVVGLAALVAGGYLLKKGVGLARNRWNRSRAQRQANHAAQQRQMQQQLAAANRRREVNERAKWLQVSLMQLEQVPDFQRALYWAEKCKDIPLAFRQRQYRRFRQNLSDQLARRLAAGENAERLMDGLRSLVEALGFAPFEADYLLAEVRSHDRARHAQDDNFEERLREYLSEHRNRVNTLTNLDSLDEDVRQQLLEAEERRFQEQLFGRAGV